MSAPNFQISAGKDGKTGNKVADVDDIAKPFVNFPGFGGGALHLQNQRKAPWGQDVLNSHSTRNQISKEPLSIDVIELNTFKCTHWFVSLLILISSLLSSPDKF